MEYLIGAYLLYFAYSAFLTSYSIVADGLQYWAVRGTRKHRSISWWKLAYALTIGLFVTTPIHWNWSAYKEMT